MNDVDGNSEFERRVRQALRDSSDALDGRTRSKLTQARYAALDGAASSGATSVGGVLALAQGGLWRWVPAGAAAAVLLVTMMYVSQRNVATPADDLAMLADADVYALHADAEQEPDYDFYEWAAAAAETDGESGS
jgi:hypothetical protein